MGQESALCCIARPSAFHPSGLDDNPYLDKEEYLKSLDNWTMRPCNALFDWFASVEGLVFGNFNDANLTFEEPNGREPVMLAIDDGYFPDPRATLFVQMKPGYLLVFDELYQHRTLEEQTVRDIQKSSMSIRCAWQNKPL